MTPWISLGVSMLIGTLVGLQREAARTQASLGLRDFLLTAMLGWLSGLLHEAPITVTMVLILSGINVARRFTSQPRGITTELAQLLVFGFAYTVSQPQGEQYLPLITAVTVATTLILGVKDPVKVFVGTYITAQEVTAAGQFLALIFIIYPLLPDARYGPYGFFNPSSTWLFVILVSGVGFIGYFLRKYLGQSRGDWATGLVGGLVSTTVTTSAFAADARSDPSRLTSAWSAATASNAVQFGRILILLSVAAPDLVGTLLAPGIMALASGLILAAIVGMRHRHTNQGTNAQLESPLRIILALQFAVYMTVISFISAAALHHFGQSALLGTAALGSLMDVDAVILSTSDLVHAGITSTSQFHTVVVIAIVTNMIIKLGIALANGTTQFFLRLLLSFTVMIATFLLTLTLSLSLSLSL